MGTYVGLDVSLKETSVCILRDDGSVVFEGKVATDPAVLARLLRMRASDLIRVGLESGPTSAWLTHALAAEGFRWSASMLGMRRQCCRYAPTSPILAMRAAWQKWCRTKPLIERLLHCGVVTP